MTNWIDQFLEATKEVETPKQWLKWSALCSISAIVAPNVYMNKGGKYRLRPNLFVLLVGDSGLGKGYGISVSRRLVKLVNTTRVISGRGSIEGIIKALATTRSAEGGQVPIKDSRGYLNSGEFAASLYESTHALTILTDLYDGHYNDDWENTLKNSPIEKLKDICLTLLSGANQDMFDLAIDKHHLGGGFIGRTLLIKETKRAKSNSLLDDDEDDLDLEALAVHLRVLSRVSGKFHITPEAKARYDEWFYPYRDKGTDDKTGTYQRLNDHVLKVTMCLALAREEKLIIEAEDINTALEYCQQAVGAARQVTAGTGQNDLASKVKAFMYILVNAPEYKISREQVLVKGFHDFNSVDLDKIVDTLMQTGFIKQFSPNSTIYYQLSEAGQNWWESKTKG